MLEGDPGAWREFLAQYGRLIRYLGRRLRLDSDEIDDLFQLVCLQVHRKLGSLENPRRLSSWIYSVTLNEARQCLRKRRPNESLEQESVLRQVEAELGSGKGEAELREALDDAARVREALDGIDERCRRLLEALYFRDPRPAYIDVSAEFGIAVGSIGPIRGRCLERLERRLVAVSDGEFSASTPMDGDETGRERISQPGSSARSPARPTSRRNR